MGNSSSSSKTAETRVDQGFLTPHGIYTGPHDWNQHVVGHLILERRLAPFYRPLEDYNESWDDDTILSNRRGPGIDSDQPPSNSHDGHKHSKSHQRPPKELQRPSDAQIYRGAVECPICFMYYPSNINRSRCCFQAICTECFVQIKRNEPTPTHLVSEPACCPYCQQENFGVTYNPPPWRSGLLTDASAVRPDMPTKGSSTSSESSRRKSLSHDNPTVVTTDQIRPDWEERLAAVKAAVARRANRRIIMRQVGDRLIPVGVTSSRTQLPEGITTVEDIEELMLMEAMRLSLLEHERSNANSSSATTVLSTENSTVSGNIGSQPVSNPSAYVGGPSTVPKQDDPQLHREVHPILTEGNEFVGDAPSYSVRTSQSVPVPPEMAGNNTSSTSDVSTPKSSSSSNGVALTAASVDTHEIPEHPSHVKHHTSQEERHETIMAQEIGNASKAIDLSSATVGCSIAAKDAVHVIPTSTAEDQTPARER